MLRVLFSSWMLLTRRDSNLSTACVAAFVPPHVATASFTCTISYLSVDSIERYGSVDQVAHSRAQLSSERWTCTARLAGNMMFFARPLNAVATLLLCFGVLGFSAADSSTDGDCVTAATPLQLLAAIEDARTRNQPSVVICLDASDREYAHLSALCGFMILPIHRIAVFPTKTRLLLKCKQCYPYC